MAISIRMCAGCRVREPKTALVRLVWDVASGGVVIDSAQRLPGRGVYLHPACVGRVLKMRAIPRGLRRSVDPGQAAAAVKPLAGSAAG